MASNWTTSSSVAWAPSICDEITASFRTKPYKNQVRLGTVVAASGFRQMQTMAKTLRKCRQGLFNWYDHPISTAPLEGINNKIEALQRRAYGYRNYEHLKEKLLTLHHTKFTLQG